MELNKDFDCIYVDATLRLHKNWSRVAAMFRDSMTDNDGNLNCPKFIENKMMSALLRSFFQSIRKLARAYSSNKIVLLWDKSEYHNGKILKSIYEEDTFKADRVFSTNEIDVKLFQIRAKTKYHIINNYGRYGLPSIIHQGYEADILAKIASDNSRMKSAICSIDSDWKYIVTPTCPELIHMDRMSIQYYDKIKEACLGEEPWIWNIFHSSFYGSHNNLQRTVSNKHYKREFEEIREELIKGDNLDEVFDNWKLLVAQIQSWNYEAYPDYDIVREKVNNVINTPIAFAPTSDFLSDIGGAILGSNFYESFQDLMLNEKKAK